MKVSLVLQNVITRPTYILENLKAVQCREIVFNYRDNSKKRFDKPDIISVRSKFLNIVLLDKSFFV